ncbi:MAG TPA: L-threonylcarbamoyladenylate synthase [Flavisolibacter sp.]|nr:L-threonylcarbamoyladenylate synthase [Flavisolibacter sp.]
MKVDFLTEVESALRVLRSGGVILYPTDTIWGLGCHATNATSIQKIYGIKKRDDSKSLIILVADERDVLQYVAAPDLAIFDFLEKQTRPTTVIFENAVNLPDNLVADDGSIAIRIVKDEFCRHLIKRLRMPLVSTSANISGHPAPVFFDQVSDEIKASVDHVVQWRQEDKTPSQPSQIIKWRSDGNYEIIRS